MSARLTRARLPCRGPTGTLLNELADASFSHADCRIIFVRYQQSSLFCLLCHRLNTALTSIEKPENRLSVT